MSEEVSTFRLYLLRALYLVIFLGLGFLVWPKILNPGKVWDPLPGVAYSFWAAFSVLAALGLRYPLKMLPLLFLQLFYKCVWLLAVALPLASAGRPSTLTGGFVVFVVLDLLVIPWRYVLATYVTTRGDRWS
jgi:hypothetical protein